MRQFTLALGLLLTASVAGAADWTYASTGHFEVYTTGGARTARDALTYFERVRAFFTEFLNLTLPDDAPTRLIVFSGDKQFAPYRPNAVAVAFYQPGPDRDFIVMKSFDEDANATVVHEYAHLIIRHSGANYPLWLNEGLAEFFSTLEPDGGRMSIGRTVPGSLQYLTGGGAAMMELDRLFGVGHDSPEYTTRTHAGVFYSQSWALTHMLLTDDRYRPRSDQFLRAMQNGGSSAAALTAAYGKTPAQISADLLNYVRQGQYLYFLATYKAPAGGAAIPVRVADGFEADLVTANLLANMVDRERDARAAFERLAAQKPDDLALIESRAIFELRRGHRAEALPYFARAVELGSKTPDVYVNYARLDQSKAESLLARAVALAPQDLEARLLYASALLSQRKTADVLATLASVKRVPQDSAFMLFQLLANAYVQDGRVKEASDAAAQAVQYARPGEEAAYAARLKTSIDDFAARRTSPAPAAGAGDAQGSAPSNTPASPLAVVEGRMRVVCDAGATVLEVTTGAQTVRLLLEGSVRVSAPANVAPPQLSCTTRDVPATVGYEPAVDARSKTVGRVRAVSFRSP